MPHYINTEKKKKLFKEHGGAETNTGSVEGQIAVLSFRISSLSDHLKTNKKDFSTQRGQAKLIGRRKRLLKYLQRTNLESYRSLIGKLGIRR